MKYVYIETTKVKDIVRVNPYGIFKEDYASKFIEAPDDVEHGWLFDGNEFSPPPKIKLSVDELKTQKHAALTVFAKSYMSAQMSDYSEWEAISWPMLIQEAERFTADGTVGEYMTAEIGVKYPTATDLAAVILQRKEMMKQLRAGVVLWRQVKEAEIHEAANSEDPIAALNKINIQAGLPA